MSSQGNGSYILLSLMNLLYYAYAKLPNGNQLSDR